MDGWKDRWLIGWVDGERVDRWVDGRVDARWHGGREGRTTDWPDEGIKGWKDEQKD